MMLSASEGNILDDARLVETLSSSKATALQIGTRVQTAERTQREIATARASYLPAAARGSLLYFVTADLAMLDPMYQFSLGYFSSLFLLAVQQAAAASDLSVRLANIMDHATLVVFENVSRGLFEAHKATFAFLVAAAILRANPWRRAPYCLADSPSSAACALALLDTQVLLLPVQPVQRHAAGTAC